MPDLAQSGASLDLLSALQKSIRGSDPDAAVYYLGRLLAAGDLLSPCRRLLVIAAEDVGLAYPQAMAVTKACVDAARELGLPVILVVGMRLGCISHALLTAEAIAARNSGGSSMNFSVRSSSSR